MTDHIDILREARAIISDESCWTQGEFARDAQGRAVPPVHYAAVRWCIIGACAVALSNHGVMRLGPECEDAIQKANPDISFRGLQEWQDNPHRSHAEVLRAIDNAIEG